MSKISVNLDKSFDTFNWFARLDSYAIGSCNGPTLFLSESVAKGASRIYLEGGMAIYKIKPLFFGKFPSLSVLSDFFMTKTHPMVQTLFIYLRIKWGKAQPISCVSLSVC